MKRWQKILCWSIAVLLVVYAIVMSMMMKPRQALVSCNAIEIEIADSADHQYITSADVVDFLKKNNIYPIGKNYEEVDCYQIVSFLKEHSMVETATCYITTDGVVCIEVEQRQPVLRVIADKSYFVDTQRKVMPVNFRTATYVPIITGRVTEKMATNELFDFVMWLEDDKFWNAQVEQINVNSKREIELVPRVGGGIILLGKLDENYADRLDKLRVLYEEFASTGWKTYNEFDLRFDGQIVCR